MPDSNYQEIEMTVDAFIATYGQGNEARQEAAGILPGVLSDAHAAGAVAVYVSGSFITNKEYPGDIDLLVLHRTKESLPTSPELPLDAEIPLDVQFASLDEPEILSAFLDFLTTNRSGQRIPVVRINLVDGLNQPTLPPSNPLVRRAIMYSYAMRHTTTDKRVLVTLHGILTHAPWNADLCRLASAQDWVVAPYVYGYTFPFVLISRRLRRKHVMKFGLWLDSIRQEHEGPISVVAHSFGTYIIGRYLTGWDENGPPVQVKSLILTGSILSEDIVWDPDRHGVQRVHNEIGPNDNWVQKISWVSWFGRGDPIGRAGTKGFRHHSRILTQTRISNFDHSNPLSAHVIRGRWLPFLNFWQKRR